MTAHRIVRLRDAMLRTGDPVQALTECSATGIRFSSEDVIVAALAAGSIARSRMAAAVEPERAEDGLSWSDFAGLT